MTNEEAINVLTLHKEHWERLVREHIAEKQEGNETVEALGKAIEALKNERPQGEWKDITPNHYFTCGGEPLVVCPFCGDQESKHVQGIENYMWNFCPNCGADMREVEE